MCNHAVFDSKQDGSAVCLPSATLALATQYRVNGAGIQLVFVSEVFYRLSPHFQRFTRFLASLLGDA
jgi:hypothetical protein